jgi:redox-sensitive bicupin YhaK (pirin superfamily)
LHEEFHSDAFIRSGGTLDMVQLWVNLPARDKMSAPGYQAILNASIPTVPLPDAAGSLRVIAGEYAGQAGPARTFSPISVWDVRLNAGGSVELPAAEGWNTAVAVLHGTVLVNGQTVAEAQLALLERDGRNLTLEASSDAVVLLLSGEPIDEPIVGHGPFVMNTDDEIERAISDFENGQFGKIPV